MEFKNWLDLQETLILKGSYKGGVYQRLVAASYEISPVMKQDAITAYMDLVKKMKRQEEFLKSKFQFKPTELDPYRSMRHMTKQIEKQKEAGIKKPTVRVFAEPPGPEGEPEVQGHPVMPNDINVMVRGVHDVITHYYGQHPFSARGEYGAYNRHLKTLCNPQQVKAGKCLAAAALFTEIIGQTSYYYVYGDYPPQKAVILNDFDHVNIGALAPQSPLRRYFVVINKNLIPRNFSWEEFSSEFPKLATELERQEKLGKSKIPLAPLKARQVA